MTTNTYIDDANSISTNVANAIALTMTGDDTLIVAATGHILSMGSGGTALYVNGYADGAIVDVDGLIRATHEAIYDLGDNTTINIYGRVASDDHTVGFGGDSNKLFIASTGVVSGGVAVSMGGQYNVVINEGSITTIGDEAFQLAGSTQHIINTGSIISNFIAFSVEGANDTIDNSGYVYGSAQCNGAGAANLTVNNSGLWDGGVSGSDAYDTVSNTGHMTGSLYMNAGTDQVINSGAVDGAVLLGDDADYLDTRSGSILVGYGEAGSDTLYGGAAADVFYGGLDNDVLKTGGGDDEAHGDTGNDKLNTGDGDDLLTGDDGGDLLKAGRGDDTLSGGLNSDTLVGGAGDDLMTGGKQGDVFQFRGDFGHDLVTDFEATGNNHDTLSFSRHLFTGFSDVQAHMAQVGADVVIHAGDSDVVLQNVTLGNLVAADFSFIS